MLLCTVENANKRIYITKLDQRFLIDGDGKADKLLMASLKQKVRLGTILGDTPKHLLPDQGMFDPWGIIFGLVEAVLLGSNKFNIPKYEKAKTVYEAVKNIDCRKLYYYRKQ